MFIGHLGIGLAAKKFIPSTSLGTIFIAIQLLDLLWPTFLLLNIEHATLTNPGEAKLPLEFTDYPFSHSLLMTMVWALVFGTGYALLKKDYRSGAWLAICVASHWLADLIVHVPDLPLAFGQSSKLGLGLWEYPFWSNALEIIIFGTGLYLLFTSQSGKYLFRSWGFRTLMAVLVIIHVLNLLGPPPPDIMTIAWSAQLMWLFVLWGFWIDRKPTPIQPQPA